MAASEVELPPACGAIVVSVEDRCDEPHPAGDDEADDTYCEQIIVVDGQPYDGAEPVHPADVVAEEWLLVDGDCGIDRVARGTDDVFVHIVDEGWRLLVTY